MITFISDSYDYLKNTLAHMNSIKPKIHPGQNITDLRTAILVDADIHESEGVFKPEHLWHITCIFEDTSDYRFHLWYIQKYKKITEFTNKFRVCDMDVISLEDLITYESLVQEATR